MAKAGREFERLMEIMAALRKGCPWDRKQTPATLKSYILEEAYEVLEAVDEKDPAKIKEELGDLLFQIIFEAHIFSERGEFEMKDVLTGIAEKMIRRHPHVFGEMRLKTPEEVIDKWQEHKKKEGKLARSVLEGIPASLPALLRAQKVQKRAARVGFDWERVEDVAEKLDEEIKEFKKAVKKKKANRDEVEEEFGDILFSLVNVARFAGVNPEDALRKTTAKFITRFKHIEKRAKEKGFKLEEMSLKDMDALWDEAKKKKSRRF
jgi:tetrapyrrole methylase family protein/MazG family protein